VKNVSPAAWITTILAMLIVTWGGSAHAQEWLRNRRYGEGPGIRLGDTLVLHPGLGVEGGYDTNFFYAENATGTGRLRVTAHLDLATRPPQRTESEEGEESEEHQGNVSFRLGVSAAYLEYLTGVEYIAAHRNVDLTGLLDLVFLPGRTFSVFLNDTFIRSVEPRNEEGTPAGEEPIYTYNRDTNDARITFQYAPGSGTLELRLGYAFQLRYFEDGGAKLAYLGNYTAHHVFMNVRWRFLPKTALIFTGSFRPIMHADGATDDTRTVHDSYHVRGAIGLVGLLTRRFSLLFQIGYGAGFYVDGGPDYENVVGRLDLRFHITPTAQLSLGYSRDFYDGLFADYYSGDRVALTYDHLIAGRVMLSLSGGFAYLNYSEFQDPFGGGGTVDRADPMLDASLFVEYRIRDWIAINATVRYLGNLTDFVAYYEDGVDPGNFHQVLALAGVRAMY
jgi:hypothetical protein